MIEFINNEEYEPKEQVNTRIIPFLITQWQPKPFAQLPSPNSMEPSGVKIRSSHKSNSTQSRTSSPSILHESEPNLHYQTNYIFAM